jgi:hypothetical protein
VPGSVLPGGLNFDIAKTPFLTPIFPGERRVFLEEPFLLLFRAIFSAGMISLSRACPALAFPHLQEHFALRDTACLLGDNFRVPCPLQ